MTSPVNVYLVGSLKDTSPRPFVDIVATVLRQEGWGVFDDWRCAGPEGDMWWRRYEEGRGHNYIRGLHGYGATNARDFDLVHLGMATHVVAVPKPFGLPGADAVAELSFARWSLNKPTAVILNGEPRDWSLMLPLAATRIYSTVDDLKEWVRGTSR